MNYLYLGIILSLIISFALYFFMTRKLIRSLLESLGYYKQIYTSTQIQFNTLNNQYRQLALINKAFMAVTKKENKKK